MRSHNGFAPQSPQHGFYGPPQSRLSTQPTPIAVHRSPQSSFVSPAQHVNSMSYLHPESHLSTYIPSRANMGSPMRIHTQPPLFSNNYVGEGHLQTRQQQQQQQQQYQQPLQHSQSQQSTSKYHQNYTSPRAQPSLAQSTYANTPVTATQAIYKQTPYKDSGYSSLISPLHHPATFEAAHIANQMRTTSIVREQTTQLHSNQEPKPSEIAALNEVQLDRVKVYKPQNIERVFGRDVTFECNYEPLKLFSTKDLRGFIVNSFEDFEKNLRRLEANFTGLESSFFHLLHKAESPKDIFDRFLVALDKRIEKFFEAFNESVVQKRGAASEFFDVHVLRNDFEFWNFKAVIRQGIIEISNRVNDLFLARENSTHYDAQVIRAIETIIRINGFLKTDLNGVLHKSLLKYGRILELCTYDYNNGEVLKSLNFAEFVQLDVQTMVQSFNDDFERSYPVLLNKKQIVTEKLHEILRDKSTQNAFDLKQLVRSVFSRERRKVYSTIYNVIAKNGKNEFGLTEELERENKEITEKMNKIKEKFLELKIDPLYLEVLSGRVNVEQIKNSQTLFDDNPQGVLLLETFMVSVQALIEDIRDALADILRHKENEAAHYKSVFETTLSNAVYDLSQQEKAVQEKGDMSEYMLQQFQSLEKALQSDNMREDIDSTIDAKLFSQLQKNSGNYNLHNIAADKAREGKEKEQKRAAMLENNARKTKEFSQQIATFMTNPMVDKERQQHPTKVYEDEYGNRSNKSSGADTKGLADKLLETIKQRREDELEREMRVREEQEEIRLMKENQLRDEKDRVQAERTRAAEMTERKFRERREKEQAELQSRINQRDQQETISGWGVERWLG